MNSPSNLFEDYTLGQRLGAGATAVVHEAVERSTGRHYALKTFQLDASSSGDPEHWRRRMRREAKLGEKAFSSDDLPAGAQYVCQVHALIDDPFTPRLVLECVRGETLDSLLSGGDALPPDRAVELGIQLLQAIGFLHSRNVVHRDVKCANIVIAQETGKVKLCDLGIGFHPDLDRLTQISEDTADVVATPAYAAPEALFGEPDVDRRRDIWSFGVVLYRMLAGKMPFAGGWSEIAYAVLNEEREPAEMPSDLDAVIDRCLARVPDERYGSAEEVLSDLAAARLTAEVRRSREPDEQERTAPPYAREQKGWKHQVLDQRVFVDSSILEASLRESSPTLDTIRRLARSPVYISDGGLTRAIVTRLKHDQGPGGIDNQGAASGLKAALRDMALPSNEAERKERPLSRLEFSGGSANEFVDRLTDLLEELPAQDAGLLSEAASALAAETDRLCSLRVEIRSPELCNALDRLSNARLTTVFAKDDAGDSPPRRAASAPSPSQ